MIFDAYSFFKPIVEAHAELTGIYSCSGFSEMEDILSGIRKLHYPVLLVEDAPECTLDISDVPGANQHLLLYVICNGGLNDTAKRMQAFKQAAQIGEELMQKLKRDIRNRDGFDGLRLNEKNINMQRIGPMVNNGYGYSFMYSL